MTSDTDTTDLLGCFEQVDVQRKRRAFLVDFDTFYQDLMRTLLVGQGHKVQGLEQMTRLRSEPPPLSFSSLPPSSPPFLPPSPSPSPSPSSLSDANSSRPSHLPVLTEVRSSFSL